MAVTPPPTITPAPTPAIQRGDRTTFASRVDAFITWLIAAVAQFSAVASNVFSNATDAAASASSAGTSLTNANLAKWAAETARDAAQTAKGLAETAKGQAEQARDAAAASAAMASGVVAFVDSNSIAKGSVDASKQVRFECDALIPTGTVVPLTVPAAGGTIATLSDLQEMTRAMTYYDNGVSTAVAYALGGTQRVAPPSGAKTMSFTGWPAGRQAVQFLELVNIGLGGTPAWPAGTRFIRYDGALQTTAAAANITWQTSGTDYVMVSTRDGGATLIVSVLRG
ncbi:hypothetical protein F2P44_31600 [Massilia sp. CCM 8695]|uniref:Uncharacterized protein n=1 Tax=Massilia frigida TaxID=2609281 RepID=A0ABX0NJ66_9BURK|nr:hypothetical protein [Massilia frigida]NHZ83779.1 hypothetical protein [Massilia frigida]